MEILTKKESTAQVVAVKGRVDAVTAPEFEKFLLDLVAKGEKKFVVDFSLLEYISSAGLRSVLSVAKKLKGEKGDIFFAGLQGPVEEVFKISGFYSIFKIFDSEQAALQQI
jgi:anti-anti-sigma factor